MENTILQQLGLDDEQIIVYEYLLKEGVSKASQIAKNTPLKRGLVYKVLDELVNLKIVEKDDPEGAVATFEALHPSALKSLAESRMRDAQNTRNYLETELGSLISMYNLANNKPGIEFYEGVEGIKKVINDTLTSKTIIYTYADAEEVKKHMNEINQAYLKERKKYDIYKKLLLVDSEFSRNYMKTYDKLYTEARFVKNTKKFATVMQIYDNKISYITFKGDNKIGVIIEDKNIYEMHKTLFENDWDLAQS